MLGTFLDKATGLLDRRFLIAYWFPVFIALVIVILIRVYICGLENALDWWQQDLMLKGQQSGFYAQIWFIIGALITTTVLAYLLKPFTRPIIRFYEGYWPLALQRLFTGLPVLGEKSIWKKKTNQLHKTAEDEDWQKYNRIQAELFYSYPPTENLIMPTSLGNTLRAAENYSNTAYGMNSIFWWPRLWPLLPDVVRNEIDESLTSIVALLNFTSLIGLASIFGTGYLRQVGFGWQVWLEPLVGIILAIISYRAAVVQAQNYGENIRTAIDLYRFDLLKALHQSLPKTLDEEIAIWERLISWLYIKNVGSVADMKYNHEKS